MSDKSINNKIDKKLKFHENGISRDLELDRIVYVPGILPTSSNHQSNDIEVETYLLHPETTYKNKTQVLLDTDEQNKEKDYRNFTLSSSKNRESLDHSFYTNNGFKGNGRGFGDHDVDTDLRYGVSSRLDINKAREADLNEIKLNNTDSGLNEAGKYVLPFPRGGIDTRNLDKYRK